MNHRCRSSHVLLLFCVALQQAIRASETDKRMIDLLLFHGTNKAETHKAEDYHKAENEREEAVLKCKMGGFYIL